MPRTLAMLELVAQGERDIERGRLIPQREVFKALRKRLSPK